MIDNLRLWLQQRIKHWTKPVTIVLIPGLCLMPIVQREQVASMPAKSAARLYRMQRSATMFKLQPVKYSG